MPKQIPEQITEFKTNSSQSVTHDKLDCECPTPHTMSQPKSNEAIANKLTEEFMWTEEWDGSQVEVEELIVKALAQKDKEVAKARKEEVLSIKGFLMSYAGSQDFGKMIDAVNRRLQHLATPKE